MNRRVTASQLALVGLGLLCLSLSVATGAAAPVTADGPADPTADDLTAMALGIDEADDASFATTTAVAASSFDRSVVDITVNDDGSARWTFRYERALTTDDQREEFESFAETFRTEETALYENFREDAQTLVADGANATNREMAAERFDRDAFIRTSLDNDLGVVELQFTWRGFGTVDGDRVVVGDVFEGGLYVAPNQEFVYRPGDGLAFESVDPAGTRSDPESLAESSSVTWKGEQQFTDRRPRAVLKPADQVSGAPGGTSTPTASEESTSSDPGGTDSGGDDPGGADPGESDSDDAVSVWLMAAILVIGIGGVVAWQQGMIDGWRRTVIEGSVGALGGSSAASNDASPDEAGAVTPVANEHYHSDEERVVSLLRENGGRMKQSRIVDETDWSKSKVSVLLSEMEDDETLSRLRVGRENVVSLDGYEPEAARSPLDQQ